MRHGNSEESGPFRHWERRFARGRFGHGPHPGDTDDGGHRHGGHGGGSRLGRFFEHGDLRLVVLQLIAEKPRHGYEIIKAIEEKAGGAYTPSPGAIYPTLTLLEELGHLTVTDGADGRKLHAITEEGAASLVANRKAVEAVFARIAQAGASAGAGPAPLIRQALDNLRQTLRLRLSRGPLDEAAVQRVAAALDEARRVIEQG